MSPPSGHPARQLAFLLGIALPFFGLDQLTKWWAVQNIAFRVELRPVIENFFYLCYWDNTGMAWGLFKDNNLPFIVLSFVALVGLAIGYFREVFPGVVNRSAVGLLTAGILGNLTDRLVHGHVVDLLLFYLHVPGANPFPAFNVADSCICVAAALFIACSFKSERPNPTGDSS